MFSEIYIWTIKCPTPLKVSEYLHPAFKMIATSMKINILYGSKLSAPSKWRCSAIKCGSSKGCIIQRI
jgi:hypothetical protein